MSELVDDLEAVRRELATRGRCKINLFANNGKVCLDGAIALAYGFKETNYPGAWVFLRTEPRAVNVLAAIVKHLPSPDEDSLLTAPYQLVWSFNDDPETTDRDVFEVIDKALLDARFDSVVDKLLVDPAEVSQS